MRFKSLLPLVDFDGLEALKHTTVAVIGYAVWSTLRSDEDLWVETDDE